MTVLVLVTKLC